MIGDVTLRELVRSVNVAYAVPYVATLLGIVGLACFALAIPVQGGTRWVITLAGVASILTAIVTILYAVLRSPGLLRSGTHVTEQRLLDLIGDASQDAEARAIAGDILVANRRDIDVPKISNDRLGNALAETKDDTDD